MLDKMSVKAEPSEEVAGQEKETSHNLHQISIAVQCGSDKAFEDSNIVLVKSWSDNEDDQEGDKLAENKKLRRKEKRDLKRKLLAESTEEVVMQKKSKTDEDAIPESDSNQPEKSENTSLTIKSEDLEPDATHSDNTKKTNSANALKQSRPGYSEDRFSETTYYFDRGLRKVYPYYFTFTTFTKGRWVGDTILDVFSREFRAHPSHEYKRCIEVGSLTVNYEKVAVDYKLKHNDLLANVVHRHEVPVVASPIEVVHIDKDVVVINKPASIPVHPCGRYRHNTIVFILAKEYNLKNLRTIHRLDRLTSGMLMFGRTVRKALELEEQIRNRLVHKEYVCRVEGNFPFEEIECTEPIEVVSYKIGVCKVSPKGKECSTTFKKIGYNPKTNISVVRCMPHTGRMHQIRVHLQYLGYPVLRDPLYNHPVFGPEKGKGGNIGKTDDELIKDLIHIHNAENWLGIDGSESAGVVSISPVETASNEGNETEFTSEEPMISGEEMENLAFKSIATQTNHDEPDSHFRKEKLTKEPTCSECNVQYRDPKPMDLVMYLHALRYEGPNWSYETSLPPWADVNWMEE